MRVRWQLQLVARSDSTPNVPGQRYSTTPLASSCPFASGMHLLLPPHPLLYFLSVVTVVPVSYGSGYDFHSGLPFLMVPCSLPLPVSRLQMCI
jgi:hypothetical protein